MKRFLAAVLAALMALTCFGCVAEDRPYVPSGGALESENGPVATEPQSHQELTMAYYADRSMNPFQSNDFTNRALLSLLYQGLFSVDRDYQVIPVLCSRYQISRDMMTYTIYIEEDARFTDGTPVTVGDALASYQAAMSSAYYGGRFTHVDSVYAENNALVFRLSTPMEDLPMLLDVPIVKADQTDRPVPLGSGPYVFNDAITGAFLSRAMDWWCADRATLAVTAPSIALITAQSPAHIRDEFQFYDLDLVCANPCSDLYADYRCDFELWDCENGELIYLGCNVANREIFSTNALRSLLTFAIDRDTLTEKYYQGFARAVTLPASTYFPYYSTGLAAKYEYDPDYFAQSLTTVSLPREKLKLLVNSDDTLRLQVAREIAASLTAQGLPTVTAEAATGEYTQRIRSGDYDLYLGCTRLSANMDLSAFFSQGGALSYNGISSENLYKLSLDALENHGNYYTLYQKVAQDGRIIPLIFCSYAVYATRGLLSDLTPARDNVFFYTIGKTAEDALMAVDYDAVENNGVGAVD